MNTIGIKSLDFFHIATDTNLKNDLLYFNEIIIDQEHFKMCSDMVHSTDPISLKEKLKFSINEIEFLEKQGLVKIENINTVFKDVLSIEELDLINFPSDYVLKDKNKTKSQKDIVNELFAQMHLDNVESNLNARKICSKLNEKNIFNVKPILEIRMENHPNFPDFSPLFENKLSKNTDIANLVLRKTPIN